MDGEYVGGDGSEGERGNVKFLGLRRSCLPPATLHRRSLPNASPSYEGSACLPRPNMKRPTLKPTQLLSSVASSAPCPFAQQQVQRLQRLQTRTSGIAIPSRFHQT